MTRHLTGADAPLDVGDWDDADDILDPDELDELDPFAEDRAVIKADYERWLRFERSQRGQAAENDGPKKPCGNCGKGEAVAQGECPTCYRFRKRRGFTRPVESVSKGVFTRNPDEEAA